MPFVRFYYCGEYGDKLDRPHYHLCLFGVDFPDKEHIYTKNGRKYYKSEILSRYWKFGNNVITDLTFESAAYVSRYCTKKLNGEAAKEYGGRLPPFGQASLKPGIGALWVDRFGFSDLYSNDRLVVRGGHFMKSPRYYDKLLEKRNPELFFKIKQARYSVASDNVEHPDRAIAREVIVAQRSDLLKRGFHDFN